MASRGLTRVMMKVYGAKDHLATVVDTEFLAPHFVRVRMHSPTLFQDPKAIIAPTAYLRFWFPDPSGSGREHQRGYTISEATPAEGKFAVDFVLHEPAGPASSWAAAVQPGATIEVTSLASTAFKVADPLPHGYLLVGDAAAIPAVNDVINALPGTVPVELYMELHNDQDKAIPLASHPALRVHWIDRKDETSLAQAIESRDWSGWQAWVATEAGSLKHLRTRVLSEFALTGSSLAARAHWYEGRPFGKRR